MTSEEPTGKTSLSLEEIATEARQICAESDFDKMSRRFLSVLQTWAGPSAILCLAKDAAAEGGWRQVAELTLGPVTPAFERSIVKLIEDSPPGTLTRPVPVRPRDDAPGTVKVRDNWLVPWTAGESYGYMFLRGIARSLPGFGDAVTLLSQSIWPRVPRGAAPAPAAGQPGTATASRLTKLVDEAARLSEQLVGAIREERERLGDEALARRVADMEEKVSSAEAARDAAEKAREELAQQRDAAGAETDELKKRLAAAEEQGGTQANALEKKVAELNEKLAAAERAHEASKRAEDTAAALKGDLEKARTEAESERKSAQEEISALKQRLAGQPSTKEDGAASEETKKRVAALEEKLAAAEKARDEVRAEASTLKERVAELEAKADDETPSPEIEGLRKRVAELEEKLAATEKARDEAKKALTEKQADADRKSVV